MGDQIQIIVSKRTMERIIYWVIITLLAVLLVKAYFFDSGGLMEGSSLTGSTLTNISTNSSQTSGVNSSNSAKNNSRNKSNSSDGESGDDSVDATCSDGEQNQDETGVDCGGVCTDINGAYYYDGECHEEEEETLSHEYSLDIKDVTVEYSNGTGKPRVTTVDVVFENGMADDLKSPVMKVWLKSSSNSLLMQYDFTDEVDHYALLNLDDVASGDTVDRAFSLEGKYFASSYISDVDADDTFKVEVEIIDSDEEVVAEDLFVVEQ